MRAFNLIPAEERGGAGGGAGKSGGGAFVVLGLLGLLAIFALLYGSARHQISSRHGEVATLEAQAQVAQAQAARLAPYVSFMALHEQRMQAVSQLVDSRFDWAHAFHEIGRVLPKDASLASISGTIAAASGADSTAPSSAAPAASSTSSSAASTASSVTSATPAGSVPTFTLSGCATSQAEVALTLDHLHLIDGVSEVTLQSSAKGSASSGGSGGGAGGCGSGPVFAMQVAFEPLPSATTTSSTSSTSTASAGTATPATGAATGQPATSTGGTQ
jgi:Tfp pilus assembly protein PilN